MSDESRAIFRAVFGDVDGSHGLVIATPGPSGDILSELASRFTDRLLPADVPWEPYTCGFPLEQYYIVTRTFPVQASRAGMVQTHALFVPLKHCDNETLLEQLFSVLPKKPDPIPITASSITPISVGTLIPHQKVPPMPLGYPGVVRALMQGQTPVWLGQENFDSLVTFLWHQLWPDARRGLRFRVSADANDLAEWPATVVCTPFSLRVRWDARHFVDQTIINLPNPTPSEAYLIGLKEGKSLANARERLEISLPSITMLSRLEQYVAMVERDTADSIRMAVRLLGVLAPPQDQAVREKKTLLELLEQKTAVGTENDVLGLRNLEIAPFPTAALILHRTLVFWLRGRVEEGTGGVEVASEVFLAKNIWDQQAKRAIQDVFEPWDRQRAALLWHWWEMKPQLVESTMVLIPNEGVPEVESDLIVTAPVNVGSEVREKVLTLTRNHGWYQLHATILAATSDLTPLEKFRSQIEADPEAINTRGLDVIASRTLNEDVLTAALEIRDPRLIRLAAIATIREPQLMSGLDASSAGWRAIWLHRVHAGGELFESIARPTLIAHKVLDTFLDGMFIEPELIELITLHPAAGLIAYDRCTELCKTLPAALLKHALTAIAKSWLTQFFTDLSFDPPTLEPGLQQAVIQEWRISPGKTPPDAIPRLWKRFCELTESDFLAWLEISPMPVPVLAAANIGKLISQQGWSNVAKKLLNLTLADRRDLIPMLEECSNLLNFWGRAKLALLIPKVVPKEEDWWRKLLEIIAELYPNGIEDQNIWEDAAGDRSRVRGESGREQWTHALYLLRRGGAGEFITVEGLLHEMRNDFQNNPDLKLLEDVYLRYFSGDNKT